MNQTTATLSPKGQLTIPVKIRQEMNLSAGEQVNIWYDEQTQSLMLKRAPTMRELSQKAQSWIKPGTKPLYDTSSLYDTRPHKLAQSK